MTKPPNRYTKLPGYMYRADDHPNGEFCVFDRSKRDEKWYLETPRHQWLIMKMPDGSTKTARTYDEAKQIAIVSSRSVHSWDHW
jgi:dipeptidase